MSHFQDYLLCLYFLIVSHLHIPVSYNSIPPEEYFAQTHTAEIDTLLSVSDIQDAVPDWDGRELGIDVRYLAGQDNDTQFTLLVDSNLLVYGCRDSLPLTCQLEGNPSSFSISPSGRFALVYDGISPADTARYMSSADLLTGEVVRFMIAEGSNFLQLEQWRGLVTDDGKVAYELPPGAFYRRYVMVDRIWKPAESDKSFYTASFVSQIGHRMLQISERQELSRVFILATSTDTLLSFDPGRACFEPILSNSGDIVLYSSSIGICAYYSGTGLIAGSLFDYSHTQPPVISSSDSCWACTFKNSNQGIIGDFTV